MKFEIVTLWNERALLIAPQRGPFISEHRVLFFFHFSGKGNFIYLPASELTYSLMWYSFQMIDTIPCVPSWAIYPILNVCSSVHHTVACVILHWGRPEHLSWYTVWKIPTNPSRKTNSRKRGAVCTVNETINAFLQDCEDTSNANTHHSEIFTKKLKLKSFELNKSFPICC